MPEFLTYGFMQRALIAGAITALICPAIGVFLVPRRLSLIADTLAHVALAGVALGLVTAFASMRLLSSLLFGISATDPVTFMSVAAGVAAVTLCASAFPAWRAARVDPCAALRSE